jgi:hypothetical protein
VTVESSPAARACEAFPASRRAGQLCDRSGPFDAPTALAQSHRPKKHSLPAWQPLDGEARRAEPSPPEEPSRDGARRLAKRKASSLDYSLASAEGGPAGQGAMAMLTYTVFSLGEAQLHQLHTVNGKVHPGFMPSLSR